MLIIHLYLESIGFSDYKTKSLKRALLDSLQKEFEDKIEVIEDENKDFRWEIKIPIDNKLKLILVGYFTITGDLVRERAYPILYTDDISSTSHCSIRRHIDNEEFSGMIDDSRVGISLIFRVANAIDYLKKLYKKDNVKVKNIYLSAWSKDAKILLPIEKTKQQVEMLARASKERTELIEMAKIGDEEAIESLSMEDMNIFNMANDRLLTEDIYSIVDNSFMPRGIECDIYLILADILEVNEKINQFTNELIYDLKLSCNDIILHLAINAKDVVGEVKVGRRIKAKIWLQGIVDFENIEI